jgi:hypothetical protein
MEFGETVDTIGEEVRSCMGFAVPLREKLRIFEAEIRP